MFTEKNLEQIHNHGLSEAKVLQQLQIFKEGIPFANLVEPASANRGVEVLSEKEQQDFANLFEAEKDKLDLLKFIPASGAATRMFKFLHQFLENYNLENEDIDTFLQKKENKNLKIFFDSIEKFAFSSLVREKLEAKYSSYDNLEKGERCIF